MRASAREVPHGRAQRGPTAASAEHAAGTSLNVKGLWRLSRGAAQLGRGNAARRVSVFMKPRSSPSWLISVIGGSRTIENTIVDTDTAPLPGSDVACAYVGQVTSYVIQRALMVVL
jgi:hypothetical protein